MNLQDFKGIYKWKFLIPSIYIINWLLVIIGPLLFPYAYQIMCMIIIVYSILKAAGLCFGGLVSLIMLKKCLSKMGEYEKINAQIEDPYFHAIVIPSYKEDQEVLIETLEFLAQSPKAKSRFIVFLAMELHQQGSDIKATKIISKCKSKFYHMGFTQHKVRESEAKGKASNVSWCVQNFQEKLQSLMINFNNVIITIIDADSWAPKQYFQVVQYNLRINPSIRDVCMFSCPQIYTRNHLEVPVFNRTFDSMHIFAQLSNLVSVKFSFPLSNYSLSYNLAKRIGWWDTNADAIGQDFHTCQKCFWKVQQDMHTIPIYTPFNQISLSTGEGYFKDILARFWQAQRHTLGVSDVAYNCNMLFKTPFKFRNFILTLLVFEVFAMAAVIPWALLGLGIQYGLMKEREIRFFPEWLVQLLLNGATIFTFGSYIFFEWWRREANKKIYNKENDPLWRVIQYPVIFTFALFGFSIPSFIMASFAVLCSATEYRVAEKRVDKKNEDQDADQPVKYNNLQQMMYTLSQPAKSSSTIFDKNEKVSFSSKNQRTENEIINKQQKESVTSQQIQEKEDGNENLKNQN